MPPDSSGGIVTFCLEPAHTSRRSKQQPWIQFMVVRDRNVGGHTSIPFDLLGQQFNRQADCRWASLFRGEAANLKNKMVFAVDRDLNPLCAIDVVLRWNSLCGDRNRRASRRRPSHHGRSRAVGGVNFHQVRARQQPLLLGYPIVAVVNQGTRSQDAFALD